VGQHHQVDEPAGDPFFTHVLFPFYVGVLIWGGLLLRDDRLRALITRRRFREASIDV
jgi:hypothetical protein